MEKFIQREQTYNDLLSSISTNEKKIEEAQKKKDQLQQQVKSLKNEHAFIEKIGFGQKISSQETSNVKDCNQ